MASDQLNIRVTVDASQLDSGMSQAAATVNTAAERMAVSLKSAGMSAREASSALQNLGFSSAEVSSALKTANLTLNETSAASEKTARSVNNARSAFMGLNSELGLHGNRALGAFISQSQTLGPVLNAAFSGIAILGFIQLAVTAGEKISSLISDTFIFTQAQKDLDAALKQSNTDHIKALEEEKKLRREISLIGLSQVSADRQRAQYATEDKSDAQRAIDGLAQKVKLETARLDVLRQQKEAGANGPQYTGPGAQPFVDMTAQITMQETVVTSLNNQLGELQDKWNATGLAVERVNKQLSVDVIRERAKAEEEEQKKDEQATRDMMQSYKTAMEERGSALKEELTTEGIFLRENVKVNEDADKEGEKSATELAALKIKLMREVIDANNKAVREQEALLKREVKPFEEFFKSVEHANAQLIDSMLKGTQTIGAAFEHLAANMAETLIQAFVKMLEEQIAYSITSGAIGKEHALAGIMRDAYKAAANVFAEVPYPFNIPAAAGVFATVVALGGALPSAAGGWDVGTSVPSSGGLAMIHQNEMVLPAGIADNVRGGGIGGGVHFHISAIDGNSVKRMLQQHGETIVAVLKDEKRHFTF
jgi:hypothetical protein